MNPPWKYAVSTLLFLSAICFVCTTALAELPPQAYANMQAEAPELVEVRVDEVYLGWCILCTSRDVKLIATVTSVSRTATKITVGNIITIRYEHRPLRGGMV